MKQNYRQPRWTSSKTIRDAEYLRKGDVSGLPFCCTFPLYLVCLDQTPRPSWNLTFSIHHRWTFPEKNHLAPVLADERGWKMSHKEVVTHVEETLFFKIELSQKRNYFLPHLTAVTTSLPYIIAHLDEEGGVKRCENGHACEKTWWKIPIYVIYIYKSISADNGWSENRKGWVAGHPGTVLLWLKELPWRGRNRCGSTDPPSSPPPPWTKCLHNIWCKQKNSYACWTNGGNGREKDVSLLPFFAVLLFFLCCLLFFFSLLSSSYFWLPFHPPKCWVILRHPYIFFFSSFYRYSFHILSLVLGRHRTYPPTKCRYAAGIHQYGSVFQCFFKIVNSRWPARHGTIIRVQYIFWKFIY